MYVYIYIHIHVWVCVRVDVVRSDSRVQAVLLVTGTVTDAHGRRHCIEGVEVVPVEEAKNRCSAVSEVNGNEMAAQMSV